MVLYNSTRPASQPTTSTLDGVTPISFSRYVEYILPRHIYTHLTNISQYKETSGRNSGQTQKRSLGRGYQSANDHHDQITTRHLKQLKDLVLFLFLSFFHLPAIGIEPRRALQFMHDGLHGPEVTRLLLLVVAVFATAGV